MIWALTINVFYQMMATKYTTYTLPALLPIAIMSARFLRDKEKVVRRTLIFAVALLVLVTFLGLIPVINHKGSSGKDVAAFLTENVRPGDLVLSCDDYKVSRVYYSGLDIYQVSDKKEIEAARPDGKTWNSKNVWPYWAREDIPRDRTVYLIVGRKWNWYFDNKIKTEEWTEVATFAKCRVFRRDGK